MLSVRDLHRFAGTMTAEQFEEQLGPFVLVQAAPDAVKQAQARNLGTGRTMRLQPVAPDKMGMLMQLEHLMVATLPNIDESGFTIGRMPDCDLVVEDESVSKHHARIQWDAGIRAALLEDVGSSNGTFHNGSPIHGQVSLYSGDELTFGTVRFAYLMTRMLYLQLTTGKFKK